MRIEALYWAMFYAIIAACIYNVPAIYRDAVYLWEEFLGDNADV